MKKISPLFIRFLFGLALFLMTLSIIIITNRETAAPAELVPTMIASKNDQDLLIQIQSYAKIHNKKPIDATVDKVWKAIPGYNGLSIDIEASYLKMVMSGGFKEDLLLYKEVAPKVHLKDLPPSPIYKGNAEKPMVALLINVAWGNEFIPKIVETLETNDVKATFFFDGSWVKKNGDLAISILDKGHEIGNHAYSHPDLKQKTRATALEELTMTNEIIYSTMGIDPIWFAPPSGSFKQETIDIAHELGMLTILWTVDTIDWRNPPTAEMVRRVTAEVSSGSMILMHPTKPTAEGLQQIIVNIKEKGLQLGTVSEIMSEKRIENKNETHN